MCADGDCESETVDMESFHRLPACLPAYLGPLAAPTPSPSPPSDTICRWKAPADDSPVGRTDVNLEASGEVAVHGTIRTSDNRIKLIIITGWVVLVIVSSTDQTEA